MADEERDVKTDSSPVEEEAQEVVQEESTPSEEQQEQAAEPSTQEVKPEVDDRPTANVAWEAKRKIDDLSPKVDRLLDMVQQNQAQPQQPQYTKAQLRAYASEPTTTTEQRLWAYTELDKLEKSERQKEYESLVKTTSERNNAESRKAQAAQWVANTFPETVIKDQSGNVVGWNNGSQLLAKANEYMRANQNLQNDPSGFMAAVKMAAFDMGVAMGTDKKLNRTVGQLRKEQKKQLASSGGTTPKETPEAASKARLARLQEEYGKTGDRKVFEEIVKMKNLNPWV